MTILVTGGAGFIGSNFVLNWLNASDEPVVNLDKPTYADNLQNLASLKMAATEIDDPADKAGRLRLIFDDTIQEKAWIDEDVVMCWHYDHCSGRSEPDINLLNAFRTTLAASRFQMRQLF